MQSPTRSTNKFLNPSCGIISLLFSGVQMNERYTIYVPGEILPKVKPNPWIYFSKEGLRALVTGVYDRENETFIPLKTPYVPSPGDFVIGVVEEERPTDYVINIFSPYLAYKKKNRLELNPLEIVCGQISFVTEVKTAMMEELKILRGGNIVSISPSKISRVIGKKGSMLTLLKEKTNCEIIVGKNGIIWIKGDEKNVNKATLAILKIEKEAHIPGLTNRIEIFLSE
jgi:exosome complex component RRP4